MLRHNGNVSSPISDPADSQQEQTRTPWREQPRWLRRVTYAASTLLLVVVGFAVAAVVVVRLPLPQTDGTMHLSGLIDEVRASTVDVPTAEAMVLDYIRSHVKQPKSAPLAGNSIATDRGFIARDMPALDDFLHYRMIDVSSIKELCRRWYPRIYFGQPEKGLAHRALADIHESIRELQYYRRTAFVAPPEPSTG